MPVSAILFLLLSLSGILFIVHAYRQTKTRPREDVITLRFRLRHNQHLSQEVQSALRRYITLHHAGQQYMYSRVTFAKVLQTLTAEYQEMLHAGRSLLAGGHNPPAGSLTLKKLDRQFRHLLQVQREIQLFTSLYESPAALAS